MRILIKNCTLVSMSENRPKFEKNINVLIEDDKIVEISSLEQKYDDDRIIRTSPLKEEHDDVKLYKTSPSINEQDVDKIIDAKGNVLMPGLINCHCHAGMSIFRETVDGIGLQDWLEKKIWPIEEKLTAEDIYEASKISFKEMVETGTTTVNDMYFEADRTATAAKEAGIRLHATRPLMDMLGEEDGKMRIEEIKWLAKKYENDELITINAGLHGFYTSSRKYSSECIDFAKNNNLILHIHFCENSKEVQDIKNGYNQMPVEVLKNELNGCKTILAHCVKLSEQDIEDISKIDADISIATCPVSNLKLGCGVANIQKMQEMGLNVCIGTDGQGSGCNLDMFEQMKYVTLLQKGFYENPELMPAYEVLKMATINGAKALGMNKEIGTIEVGKKADMILIDLTTVLTTPINDLIAELVYNIKGSNVLATIINGKVVFERRKEFG